MCERFEEKMQCLYLTDVFKFIVCRATFTQRAGATFQKLDQAQLLQTRLNGILFDTQKPAEDAFVEVAMFTMKGG